MSDYEKLKAAYEELLEVSQDVVDSWDWWMVDTYDRCGSVTSDAIHHLKVCLDAQSSLLSEET